MLKEKDRDMNAPREVEGPKVMRPKETKPMASNLDSHNPTGTLSKHSLSDLHEGNIESPLKASGAQMVVESSPMGSHSQSEGARSPKGMGRSVAKDEMQAAKKRAKY